MLFEQAFFSLPEVLHGSGYQQQDYESGIVAAFTLSVLQVLNGRNVNNPISCIQMEKMFRRGGVFQYATNPRYLRADLFADVTKMYVANRRLSQYGWRHKLWLEAKFLRGQAENNKHSGNKTTNVANFLADLIRLSLLIREEKDVLSKSGRYFLHVYDNEPKYYLTSSKRSWCKTICTPGQQKLKINNLGGEEASVKNILGNLPDLDLEIEVTNFEASPISSANRPAYWSYLTRIDKVKASIPQYQATVDKDRSVSADTQEHIDRLAAYVATNLHLTIDSRETTPPTSEEDDQINDNA